MITRLTTPSESPIAVSVGFLALSIAVIAWLVKTSPPLASVEELPWAPVLGFAAAVSLGVGQAARADDDSEREHLARIVNELQRVEEMTRAAASDAPSGQRVRFRYDWLVRDLQLMREGIEQHVDAPRQPRPVAPLKGDYRQ